MITRRPSVSYLDYLGMLGTFSPPKNIASDDEDAMDLDELSSQVSKVFASSDLIMCKPILERYSGSEDYKQYIKFAEDKYQHIRLPQSTPQFDLYLICWNPNQASSIHDHSSAGCLMMVLEGELHERVYISDAKDSDCKLARFTCARNIQAGLLTFRHGSREVHEIKNGNARSVSLHIYPVVDFKSSMYQAAILT